VRPRISVVVVTLNEEERLRLCLESVAWADEVIVVDAESADKTVQVAREFTDRVFVQAWPGFAAQKNFGLEQATGEWVLSLDADEEVSRELRDEIRAALATDAPCAGYRIPRRNIMWGRFMRHGGLYPDWQLRLFRRGRGRFVERAVHESVEVTGEVGRLPRHQRFPGARRPILHAGGGGLGPERAAPAGRGSGPPAGGTVPLDVCRPRRVPRRLARLPSRGPLRVLCVHPLGEGMGEDEARMTRAKDRVLSGMRPSGKIHLGNFLGALDNWVRMQDAYDCFFFVANWHALTDDQDTSEVPGDTVEMLADWLGAGLDPERATLFIQSLVPEHAELHLLLSMVTPVGWLERVPTYRERIEQQGIASPSYGLFGYPVLQAADILMYKPRWVPVGIDQVPHVELTREVARRFNNTFKPVFSEPEAKLTEIPKVPGTDGRKMSKSYGNAIFLSDSAEEITRKVKPMVTDPARKRRSDPGDPAICPVFDLHKIFTPTAEREACATGCRTAGIGCLDCKDVLLKHLRPALAAIRDRRQKFAEKPDVIVQILDEGSRRARRVAEATMAEVRAAVNLTP
jgi:tryptophanyl-tRNA synthetase